MRLDRLAIVWIALMLASATDADDVFVDWADIADVVRTDEPAVMRVPTAALILGGQTGGSIAVSAVATPLPIGGPKHRVTLLTTIDMSPAETTRLQAIDLFVYALGAEGEVASVVSQRLPLDPERSAGKLGIKVLSSIDLAPGEYTLRILALGSVPVERSIGPPPAERHDGYGLQVMPLTVPALDGGQPALLTPWWLEPLEPWLVALPPGDSQPMFRPLAIDDRFHLPSAKPALEAATTAVVCLLAHAQVAPPWTLSARFTDSHGRDVETPFEIVERRLAPWPELELLLVSVRVPELPTGPYSLEAMMRAPDTEPLVSASLPVTIETGTDMPRLAAEAVPKPIDAQARNKRRRKIRLPETETAGEYTRVLRLLSTGKNLAARTALSELETVAARDAVYDQLEKIESRVLVKLAETSLDSLLPVALLHADLVSIYRQQAQAPLAEHALRMSTRLAKSVARQGSATEARSAAAKALVELAGVLLRAGRLVECQDLFQLALDVDTDNDIARLGLGFSLERSGAYEQAVAALGQLTERDPNHTEARLRLALNLERLGKTNRSRPLFEGLDGPESPDWIALLATQESARIALREQRLEHAETTLEAALERWPSHPGLRVQRAHLLDRIGQPRQARQVIARLIATVGPGTPSPRHRYNRWPADDAASRELRAVASQRLSELGRALEAVAP